MNPTVIGFGKIMRITNLSVTYIFAAILLFAQTIIAQIIITEIMRDPSGIESQLCGGGAFEFFELTNCSSDTFFLTHCFFTDGDAADSIVPVIDTISLHKNCRYNQRYLLPGQSSLILDPDYRQAIATCNNHLNIRDSTVLWQCGDTELGDGLSGNDGIVVYKGTKTKIDTIIARATDNDDNISIPLSHCVLTVLNATEGTSIVPENILQIPYHYVNGSEKSTPGWYDHCIGNWILEYKFDRSTIQSRSVLCTLMIKSLAVYGSTAQWALQSESQGRVSTLQNGTFPISGSVVNIPVSVPLDTFQYQITVNKASRRIDISDIWTPDKSIRINELYPKSSSDQPEWIEIVNRSSVAINLKNCYFGFGSDTLRISNTDIFLSKGVFCILASNKEAFCKKYPVVPMCIEPPQWYTLNNSRDSISLFSSSGRAIDTAVYDASWFTQWTSQSIERVNPDNSGTANSAWALSEQTTPGRQNSVVYWRNVTSPSIEVGPIPFTPNGDGNNDLFLIKCTVPPSTKTTIEIISFDGKTVKTFTNAPSPDYLWDGLDSKGKRVENGPFFVKVTLTDNGNSKVIRKKGVLWR